MPKIKAKKKARAIEDDQGTPISVSNQKSFNDEDEDYGPSVSHSKDKKKHKKNRADQSNEDKSPKKRSDLNPVTAQEQEEMKSDKKRKRKEKEEEKEENDACYLPGQKHDRPHERDPLRIFFEVLYEQQPDCELAATWMMEWGLLPSEEAVKVYGRQLKKNRQQDLGSPADALSLKTTSKFLCRKEETVSSNAGAKSKKRKVSNNNSEDDLIVSKIKKKKQKQKISSS